MNGPPSVGKPSSVTWRLTPVLPAFVDATTAPRMLVFAKLGRVATYATPAGLFVVIVALPSMPVTGVVLL